MPDTIRKIERLLIRDNDCIKCCLLCQVLHFLPQKIGESHTEREKQHSLIKNGAFVFCKSSITVYSFEFMIPSMSRPP